MFTAADPYVRGIGFAAWRDLGAFFKKAAADDSGTPNPIANSVTHSITRGISQSGNFLRGWLHLGFNREETGARVHDGMWPIIAGRRIALNFRWAQPDGVIELYQAGSEGPQWWLPQPDPVRRLLRGLCLMALASSAADYPARKESSWVARDFRFHSGEMLPELRLNYTTLGVPTNDALLILHGTTGSGTGMLSAAFAGDANDHLYQWDSSRVYNPAPRLERIQAALLAQPAQNRHHPRNRIAQSPRR